MAKKKTTKKKSTRADRVVAPSEESTVVIDTNGGFTFEDRLGNIWDVELTLGAAKRIDSCDFSEIVDGEEFSFLQLDKRTLKLILEHQSLLFAMIWAVVHPTAKETINLPKNASEDEYQTAFVDLMNGRAVKDGRDAFWRSIADFFPEHRTVLSMLKRQADQAYEKVDKKLLAMEPKMAKKMDQELEKNFKKLEKDLDQLGT